ncbi:MAG: hypothetical protein QOE70_2420, partial [Chthoniobacter sp.]|nr:hypothetical protein [Chthoniobacter sp.]
EINTRIFLNPVPAPEKEVYIVKSGDVLNRVAAHTKTTAELLMRANNLSGTMLRIGQKLYTSPSNFSIHISRKHSKVVLNNNGRFFKQYPIREWPATLQTQKKGAPVVKLSGKVIEKIALLDGSRVIFTDKGFANATHWITVSIPHCTLYAEPPAGADPKKASKPPSGIALDPEATAELSSMLNRGTPVYLE